MAIPVENAIATSSPRPPANSVLQFVPPPIMLVRLEPGEEPAELGLGQMPVRILRVRHPIPACTRARVVKPLVVIVSSSVTEDLSPLVSTCRSIRAQLLHLNPLVATEMLRGWLVQAMKLARAKRAADRQAANGASGRSQLAR
jgi:hypothetical protein